MNTTDGIALLLGFILFAGSISFIYKWFYGTVNDAQGLFGIAGLAISLVFPAFFAQDLYDELFVGMRHLIVVPVGTVAAAIPLSGAVAGQQVADAAATKTSRLIGKAGRGITGFVKSLFGFNTEEAAEAAGGRRRLRR
jgi:hypothetical protein